MALVNHACKIVSKTFKNSAINKIDNTSISVTLLTPPTHTHTVQIAWEKQPKRERAHFDSWFGVESTMMGQSWRQARGHGHRTVMLAAHSATPQKSQSMTRKWGLTSRLYSAPFLPSRCSMTFSNSTTIWGPGVQIPEPVGRFLNQSTASLERDFYIWIAWLV